MFSLGILLLALTTDELNGLIRVEFGKKPHKKEATHNGNKVRHSN